MLTIPKPLLEMDILGMKNNCLMIMETWKVSMLLQLSHVHIMYTLPLLSVSDPFNLNVIESILDGRKVRLPVICTC